MVISTLHILELILSCKKFSEELYFSYPKANAFDYSHIEKKYLTNRYWK